MKKEKYIMVLLDEELKEKINKQAHAERLNMSQFVRKVVGDYIDSKNGGA